MIVGPLARTAGPESAEPPELLRAGAYGETSLAAERRVARCWAILARWAGWTQGAALGVAGDDRAAGGAPDDQESARTRPLACSGKGDPLAEPRPAGLAPLGVVTC